MLHVVKPVKINDLMIDRNSVASYYAADGKLTFAAVDEARYGYNPETLDPIGLIIEDEATNLFTRSNEFSHADWIKEGAPTLTSGAIASPDGTLNAWSFTDAVGTQYIYQTIAAGIISLSFYIKKKTIGPSGTCSLRLRLAGTAAKFDITSSSPIITGSNGKIQKLQDGWYRASLFGTFSSGTLAAQLEGVDGDFYFCFAMVEHTTTEKLAFAPTSYYPSAAEAGTRLADGYAVEPPAIDYSSIPEDDYPVFDIGDSYSLGERVIVTTGHHRIYKSLVAGTGTNTGNYPPDSPTQWLDEGATNTWRMFRYDVGSTIQSQATGEIFTRILLATSVNSISFFNVEASQINVKMYYGGSTVYDETYSMVGEISESTWYNFYFENRPVKKNLSIVDLPLLFPCTIEVTITAYNETSLAKCGKMIVGRSSNLGVSIYDASGGIVDYSIKSAQDDFGNYSFIERRYVDSASLRVLVERGNEDRAKYALANVRAIPCVYIASLDEEMFSIFGKYNDFKLLFSTPAYTYLTLELEGI